MPTAGGGTSCFCSPTCFLIYSPGSEVRTRRRLLPYRTLLNWSTMRYCIRLYISADIQGSGTRRCYESTNCSTIQSAVPGAIPGAVSGTRDPGARGTGTDVLPHRSNRDHAGCWREGELRKFCPVIRRLFAPCILAMNTHIYKNPFPLPLLPRRSESFKWESTY